jgi:hypothetical protein
VNFRELQQRLIAHLGSLVRSGDSSERGLARFIGISQPHMHNILKGKKLLSMDTADRILAQLNLDLFDFIEPRELLEWQRRH